MSSEKPYSPNDLPPGPSPSARPGKPLYLDPVRIIALMAVSVFCAEALIMFLLDYLPQFPVPVEALLDSALLTLLLSPVFYFLIYRPFKNHLADRQQAEEKIRHLAYFDFVTGLPNRVLLLDRLDQALARAERDSSQVAVLFLDLDHFKLVNDRLGHEAGDQLLNMMSRRIEENLRHSDTVARLGGDEFIILLPEINTDEDVRAVLHKLLPALKKPAHLFGREITLTVSVGASLYPRDGEDGNTLLRNADQAMYAVKNGGRDGIQFYCEADPHPGT